MSEIKTTNSLIAFFSHSGNTQVIAQTIQNLTTGELFQIEAVHTYPKNYTQTTQIAKQELREKARPALKNHLESIDNYKVIFLGYPNWWGTMPMVVFTFLEHYDFSGKIIMPFCTHEGSGIGKSERDITQICQTSEVRKGMAIYGSGVTYADKEIKNWVENLM